MQVLDTVAELRRWRAQQTAAPVFVPTMGNLHAGHLALVHRAQQESRPVVVSIFVNPMQFGPGEDLDTYPRTLQADLEKLSALAVDAVFTPAAADIYPHGLAATTRVQVPALTDILCGASRRGHFDGVTTVVNILFNLVQPAAAVFGEKDYQQLQIIQRMVKDLAMPARIIASPTLREADGLAMSSRNQYLSTSERAVAARLFATLQSLAEQLAEQDGIGDTVVRDARAQLADCGFDVDYLELRDAADLLAPARPDRERILLIAARLGSTRLIDNLRCAPTARE